MSFDNSYISHVDDSMLTLKSSPVRSASAKLAINICLLLVSAGHFTVEVLYMREAITLDAAVYFYLSIGAGLFLFFLLLECGKSRIFSGLPYLNENKRQRSKAIKSSILRFMFGKAIEVCVCLYLVIHSISTVKQFEEWMEGDSLKGLLLYLSIILQSLLCEVFPAYHSLSDAYLETVSRDGSHHRIPLIVGNQSKVKTFYSSVQSKSSSSSQSTPKDSRKTFAAIKKMTLAQLEVNFVSSDSPAASTFVAEERNGRGLPREVQVSLRSLQ